MKNRIIKCGKLCISNSSRFTLIAGPCQLENEKHAIDVATQLNTITKKLNIGLIYKTSFDKANRTSLKSKRGVGLEKSLPIFDKIRKNLGIPILTDVHTIEQSGNKNILVTERGASFGYNTLVSDMRSIPIMAKNGYPVVFDATHSVQQPGGMGDKSGGQREFVEHLARAAIAVGVAAIFMETHPDPDNAPSDGPIMIPLAKVSNLLKQLIDIDNLVKNVKNY